MENILPITAFIAICLFILKEVIELFRRSKTKNKEIKALKSLIYREVYVNSSALKQIISFFEDVKNNNVITLRKEIVLKNIFIDYIDGSGARIYFQAVPHSVKIIERYLLDVSRIDENLTDNLLDLKICIEHFNDVVLCGIDEYLNANPSIDAISQIRKQNEKIIKWYVELCNKVMVKCNTKNSSPYKI